MCVTPKFQGHLGGNRSKAGGLAPLWDRGGWSDGCITLYLRSGPDPSTVVCDIVVLQAAPAHDVYATDVVTWPLPLADTPGFAVQRACGRSGSRYSGNFWTLDLTLLHQIKGTRTVASSPPWSHSRFSGLPGNFCLWVFKHWQWRAESKEFSGRAGG